jgi:nucleolar protein 9
MPKEHKNRGRREEKKHKRKLENDSEILQEPKRQKSQDPAEDVEFIGTDALNPDHFEGGEEVNETAERPFYGLLENEEQEYFRRADELLELNDFPSSEERDMFLANVYREADGKELKIACSQSCSRLMERLILLSNTDQKKKLFGKFNGNFAHLVQHRFASHCCETLFIQSAPVVTEELTGSLKSDEENAVEKGDGEIYVSMENLFLYTLNELEGQMTFLLTDRFASHTLRVLLIILSGRPLEQTSTRTLIQSKRKEKIGINNMDTAPTEFALNLRAVPSSFQYAVEKIITDTVATMDSSFIQILAVHPTGNPTLQLLLSLELTTPAPKTPSKTILASLLPDDLSVEGSKSSVFVNGILYDPIGSRLLETICTSAPGKLFKQIYQLVFKTRIAALARNEISAYVVIRVLNRISKQDLEDAVENITPQVAGLVERSRTNVVKTLLERCHARGASASLKSLAEAVASAYGDDTSTLVLKMACVSDISSLTAALIQTDSTASVPEKQKPTAQQLHGSLLAQTMLSIPGTPSTLIQNSLLALPPQTLLTLALHTCTSHIIQAAIVPSPANISFRRKLISTLITTSKDPAIEPISILSLSPTGTHILSAILPSASSLLPLIERISTTLLTLESSLRESFSGRIVWRVWSMDLFKRKRGDWVRKVKDESAAAVSKYSSEIRSGKGKGDREAGEEDTAGVQVPRKNSEKGAKNNGQPKKSAIQLARERHAKGISKMVGPGTGGNRIPVGTEK